MYNRQKAIKYAHKWWNKRNPLFYDFENLGGDCTNFISQCLYYGGFDMYYYDWYYRNLNNRSFSWTGVNEFFNFLINNKNELYPIGRVVDISQVETGDIVQLVLYGKVYHHTMLITKILGEKTLSNIYITCHTLDQIDRRLSDYPIKKIRFINIVN